MKLRSDASEKIWKVKMENRKLTIGWKEFAIAHDFRIGDVIVFRHEGDLMFHVTCLGPSFCEIQYVHLSDDNREDDDQNNIRMCPRKKHRKKSSSETETESFASDESCFVADVTDSNLWCDTRFLPRKFGRSNGLNKESNKICLMNGVRTWTLILKFRNSTRSFYMTAGWRNFCNENGFESGDSITFKLETNNNTRTPLLRFSTSECQRMSSSSSSLSETRFVTLNVTPAILKNRRLYLPQSFTRINNLENARGKKVTLLDKHGVEWPLDVVMDRSRYTWLRLGLVLKDFLKAIDVKEDESFVLELIKEETTTTTTTTPPLMFKFCSKSKFKT